MVSACYSNYCGWFKPICSWNTGTGWTNFRDTWQRYVYHDVIYLCQIQEKNIWDRNSSIMRNYERTDRQTGGWTDMQTERHAESICLIYTLVEFLVRKYESFFTAQDTEQLSVRKWFIDVHKHVEKKPNMHSFTKPVATLLLVETANRIQRGSRQQLEPEIQNTPQGG